MRSQARAFGNFLSLWALVVLFVGWTAERRLAAQEILPTPEGLPRQEWGRQPDESRLPISGQDTDVIEGTTPLAYGPMHEAFAERFSLRSEGAMVVAKEPPGEIEEQPADLPAGLDPMEWIPGYWGWDIEREDYVWVSGIWRRVPADQRWIPGYWTMVDGGWQRVSGYWSTALGETVQYLPSPPENIDNGPSMLAPTEDAFWIPGCWQYANTGFVWRSGYWQAARENWVWVPARYLWTPYGYVFRQGYWDYALDDRGILFVPIVVDPGFHGVYRPSYCVEVTPNLFSQLYVVSGCGSYYLTSHCQYAGKRQVYSWVDCHQHGYDPLYHYYSHQGKSRNWMTQISQLHHQIVASAPRNPPGAASGWNANQGDPRVGNRFRGFGNGPASDLSTIKVTKVGGMASKPSKPSRMPSGVNRAGLDGPVVNRNLSSELQRRLGDRNGSTQLRASDIPRSGNRANFEDVRFHGGRAGVTDPMAGNSGSGAIETSSGRNANGWNRNGVIEIPNGFPRNGGNEMLNGMSRNGGKRSGSIEHPTFRADRNEVRGHAGGGQASQPSQREASTQRNMSPTFRANRPQDSGNSGVNRSGAAQHESRRSGKR